MNNIGQRIKELRKKNDLTQEKLADFLGVTYQSVSKWECGTTMPDLGLIVPLARVLHVSTDELFGISAPEADERKAYFDAEYVEYWKKDDHEADYLIAKQAVEEYPGEYKYLNWLGTVEYYISFNRKDNTEFIEMMDSSIKHNMIVYENCNGEKIRNVSLWNIICAYRYSGRIEEAKKYAFLYPESNSTSRDDAIELCLEGEELLAHQQKIVSDALEKLCSAFGKVWTFGDAPRIRAVIEAEQTIIKAIIPDENTLRFSMFLTGIHEKIAEFAIADGDFDAAVNELKIAIDYAAKSDEAQSPGKRYYTCAILDHHAYEYPDSRQWGSWGADLLERMKNNKIYDPLRDRDDFKALFA